MHIFSNVLFLLIFLINLLVQAFPIPENKKATYDIWRKNKVIGTYEILFFEKDDILNIETNISSLPISSRAFIVFFYFTVLITTIAIDKIPIVTL